MKKINGINKNKTFQELALYPSSGNKIKLKQKGGLFRWIQ
jgi:hypothetical protein